MRKVLAWCVLFCGIVVVCFLLVALHFKGENYRIVHSVYVVTTNPQLLNMPRAVCYSKKEFESALRDDDLITKSGVQAFDLDNSDLIACIAPNYVVEKAVGRQDLGFIILRKAETNGISFTVLKGTKRMLQYNFGNK